MDYTAVFGEYPVFIVVFIEETIFNGNLRLTTFGDHCIMILENKLSCTVGDAGMYSAFAKGRSTQLTLLLHFFVAVLHCAWKRLQERIHNGILDFFNLRCFTVLAVSPSPPLCETDSLRAETPAGMQRERVSSASYSCPLVSRP